MERTVTYVEKMVVRMGVPGRRDFEKNVRYGRLLAVLSVTVSLK